MADRQPRHLVTFHEFGHYWVARRCGVKVLRFSVGFGRPIFRRVGRNGTEYVIGWIPLGGYVRMLDEREADVPAALLTSLQPQECLSAFCHRRGRPPVQPDPVRGLPVGHVRDRQG